MSDAGHIEIVQDKEPIRLFKSNFLEFFSHIHPAVVAIIWVPVMLYFLYVAIKNHLAGLTGSGFPLHIPLGFLLGIFLWTLGLRRIYRRCIHFPRS